VGGVSDDVEGVSPSSPNSKEVAVGAHGIQLLLGGVELVHGCFLLLLWRVGGVIIATVGVPQALPHRRGLHLLLHLALVVVVRCHSLEEFRERERVIGSMRESEWRFGVICSHSRQWHVGRDASIMGHGASNS
jgi:hypothetical protein